MNTKQGTWRFISLLLTKQAPPPPAAHRMTCAPTKSPDAFSPRLLAANASKAPKTHLSERLPGAGKPAVRPESCHTLRSTETHAPAACVAAKDAPERQEQLVILGSRHLSSWGCFCPVEISPAWTIFDRRKAGPAWQGKEWAALHSGQTSTHVCIHACLA